MKRSYKVNTPKTGDIPNFDPKGVLGNLTENSNNKMLDVKIERPKSFAHFLSHKMYGDMDSMVPTDYEY